MVDQTKERTLREGFHRYRENARSRESLSSKNAWTLALNVRKEKGL